MGFHIRVDQRFRVYSMMFQEYEKEFGKFHFDVEVLKLFRHQHYPLKPPDGDLYLKYVEPKYAGEKERACQCLAIGHHIFREDGRGWNYSPDIINGHGNWYVPDLFRRQDLWCWLVGNDVVEFLG